MTTREKLRPASREAAERAGLSMYMDAGATCPTCGVESPVRYLEGDACSNCARERDMAEKYDKPGYVFGLRSALEVGATGYYQSQKMCSRAAHLKLFSVANPAVCLVCRGDGRGPRTTFKSRAADKLAPDGVDREAARAMGFQYYRGKPCKRGHDAPRYVSTSGCMGCLGQWSEEDEASLRPAAAAPVRTERQISPVVMPPDGIWQHMERYKKTTVIDGIVYERYTVAGDEVLVEVGRAVAPDHSKGNDESEA